MPKALSTLIFCLTIILAAVGAQAAAPPTFGFDLPSLEGGRLRLEQFRGRVTVVEFFATWCRPCQRALPKLDKFALEYASRGVSAIAFSVDKGGVQVVKPFVARLGLSMPVVLGDVKWAKEHAGVRVLPTTLVISPQGRVVQRFEGPVSHMHLMAAVAPYLAAAQKAQPEAAKTKRRQPGESRFRDLWVTGNEVFQGQKGLYVHVVADVADQQSERGLWLRLDIQAGRYGANQDLYLRIDDVSVEYFVMFVRCDQLPSLGQAHSYRARVALLNSERKIVESSPEFPIAANCGVGGQYAGDAPEPRRFNLPASPPPEPSDQEAARQEPATVPLDAAQGRIKGVTVRENEQFQGASGILFQIQAELGDLPTDQGLWLALNLWPEDAQGRSFSGSGDPVTLYHLVDSTFLSEHLLFVRCDQLPNLPSSGQLRVWVTALIGPQKNVVARSKEFVLKHPCRPAQRSE